MTDASRLIDSDDYKATRAERDAAKAALLEWLEQAAPGWDLDEVNRRAWRYRRAFLERDRTITRLVEEGNSGQTGD